ncbi:hypothetical protein E4U57_003176 [Claviceps arundinis]|uniref:Uncharacterized protein n=1 Tax=Claviceps arundinis TaxID=1623583 RepID=A0A9P7SRT6_9HYPO|nr:hypothetical protein E4U57_003176 [Claviceps arundinis]KAG5970646.1 hypothetical protein E4U56_007514 [Claviceps arundinis]
MAHRAETRPLSLFVPLDRKFATRNLQEGVGGSWAMATSSEQIVTLIRDQCSGLLGNTRSASMWYRSISRFHNADASALFLKQPILSPDPQDIEGFFRTPPAGTGTVHKSRRTHV